MSSVPRERIVYDVGSVSSPGSPWGRLVLAIEPDGRAQLDQHTMGPHFTWTGTVIQTALDKLWAALDESAFPAVPPHDAFAGSTDRNLAIGSGSCFMDYHEALKFPGYKVAFPILDTVVRQLSEDTVKIVPESAKIVDGITRVAG